MISLTGGFRLLVLIFLCSIGAVAQTTTVTGPIIDPSGNTWSVATVHAVFVPTPNVPGPYVWSGGAFNTNPPTVTTDAGGNFTLTLPSNTSITPSGSSWQIITGPNATTSAAIASVMLSGGSLDISTAYTAADGWPTTRINPTPITTVYNTNQTLPPPTGQGGMVYNTSTQQMEIYTITGWVAFADVGRLPVVTNPTGNQIIAQPAGSSLVVSSLNNVLNPTLFPGADLGAKVQAALTSLAGSCGEITIPNGTYTWSTPVIINSCQRLDGQGTINVVNMTSPFLTIADPSGYLPLTQGGVSDLTFIGPGPYNDTSGTTWTTAQMTQPGLYIGGDPNGVFTPNTYIAALSTFYNINIYGFGCGVEFGNGFQMAFIGGSIHSNFNGICFNQSTGLENLNFHGTQILNNVSYGLLQLPTSTSTADINLTDVSIDYNGQNHTVGGAINLTTTPNPLTIQAGYFEGPLNSVVISVNGSLLVYGASFNYISTTNLPAIFNISGVNPQADINGVGVGEAGGGNNISELINWQSSGADGQLRLGAYHFANGLSSLPVPAFQVGADIAYFSIPTLDARGAVTGLSQNGATQAYEMYDNTGSATATWVKLGTWFAASTAPVNWPLHIIIDGGQGYNSGSGQEATVDIIAEAGVAGGPPNFSGISAFTRGATNPIIALEAAATGGSISASNRYWDIWVQIAAFSRGIYFVRMGPLDKWIDSNTSGTQPSGSFVVAGTINVTPTLGANTFTGVQTMPTGTVGGFAIPGIGTPTVGQAACIEAAGPPVVIGYCSTVVGATGACTCN